MSAEEDEYKALFVSGTGGTGEACAKRLKERGLTGRLRGTRLRSVAWKVLLEILPPYVPVAEWPARITAARAEYAALCEKHSVDPHAAEAAADPLSQDAESPWNRYFLNEELKKEINRDLERTYPEHEFFQTDATRANLNRILFVYSREHPEPSYRQGMHELLAPIYYVVYTEARTPPPLVAGDDAESDAAAALRVLLDPAYIEHDSFALFAALMNNASEFFVANNTSSSGVVAGILSPSASPAATADPLLLAAGRKSPASDEPTPAVRRCRRIFHVLLRQKDPQLYQHLVRCNIEPQLFALRWLRLLFGREFHLQDLLVLWDSIFAYGRSLSFADWICVAMLIYIREQLLSMDEVGAMRRLLKYPPVEDISLFVIKAADLCTPRTEQPPAAAAEQQAQTVSPALPQQQPQQQQQQQQQQHPRSHHHSKPLAKLPAALASITQVFDAAAQHSRSSQNAAAAAELATLRSEVAALREEKAHTTARLERIIYTLQQEIAASQDVIGSNDAVIRSLAELKQIRAVLAGVITAESDDAASFL